MIQRNSKQSNMITFVGHTTITFTSNINDFLRSQEKDNKKITDPIQSHNSNIYLNKCQIYQNKLKINSRKNINSANRKLHIKINYL